MRYGANPYLTYFVFVYAQISKPSFEIEDFEEKTSFFASVGVLCTAERKNGVRIKNFNNFEENRRFSSLILPTTQIE